MPNVTDAGQYFTTPALACDGGSTYIVNGSTGVLRFGLTQKLEAWFRTEGSGNVYAGGSLLSDLPSGEEFIVTSGSDDPGILTYGGSSVDLGSGTVSDEGWVANSSLSPTRTNYALVYNQLGFSASSVPDYQGAAALDVAKPTSAANSGTAYFIDGNMGINSTAWSVGSGEEITFLVNGDLDISNSIAVADGGFVSFFVTGDIEIDNSVNNIEGIYIADGIIDTGTADTQLVAEGTYVGWTGVTMGRDLSGVGNNTSPAELFIYRRDLIENMPGYLNRAIIKDWREQRV